MRTRLLAVASLASFSLVGMLAVVHGQRVAPRHGAPRLVPSPPVSKSAPLGGVEQAIAAGGRGRIANDVAPPQPLLSLDVDWGLQLDPDTQALYQQMANTLSGLAAVPQDRLNYYAAVNNPPDYMIGRWSGLVTDVQPADGGGYLVTISVNPVFSASPYGETLVVASDYSERYTVDANNQAQYAGFLDPNGWAGQPPVGLVVP